MVTQLEPGPRSRNPGAAMAGLDRLGGGGSEDRLHLVLIARIFLRCVRLLRPVRVHVAVLLSGFGALAILLIPFGLTLLDLIWTRVLAGQPLLPDQAALFGLSPARFVDVEALDPEARRSVAVHIVGLCAVVGAVVFPLGAALYYYQVWTLQRVNQVLRIEILDRLQALSLRFHADSRIGDAIYRLYQDSAMVTQLIDVLVLTPVGALARFAVGLLIVAAYDPALALLLLMVWPPALLVGALFARPMRVRFRGAREANSRLTSRIQETLAGIKVIKAYGAERLEQDRFEDSSRTAFERAFSARNLLAVFQVLIFWLLGIVLIIMTAKAALATRDTAPLAATAAGFTAWNLGLFSFFKLQIGGAGNAARDLFRTWGRVQDIAIGLDRVFEVLDLEPEVKDAPDAIPLEKVREEVAYHGVRFAYEPDRPVLREIDLVARVGTITALVGPTGSGKSTLLALLLRLFEPDSGRIEIDGVDLRRFQTESLRSRVSIALQENILFGDTVRENIRYAAPTASDEAVREAARIACADAFIRELPQGYDTLLGERGSKLSTGQRQRLSIARAILKDTPILILDEPTASLDAETERQVLENLARWGRGRAIFVITHRLSTIARADRIAVLREGRIVEHGSHAELMEAPTGAYRALVESERRPQAEEEAST